jgi:hypothetical protein
MVLNLFQLNKSCDTRTDPAAETESIGLSADAQLSWFLQSHLDSFIVTRDSQPLTGICPSTRIIPSGSFAWTKKLSSVNRDSSISTDLPGRRNFQPSAGTLSGPKSSRPFTGIMQKLMPARAAVGNSLNRRAVRCHGIPMTTRRLQRDQFC